MTHARKVPIKKQNLKTYSDFFISPCSAFFPSHTIRWTLFLICTKKQHQSKWATVEGTETIISGFNQILPVEIDRFWPISKNKTALKQLFPKWIHNKVKSEQFDKLLLLGGSHKEKDACVLASSMDWLVMKG